MENDKMVIYVKGASEIVLDSCTQIQNYDGSI